MNHQHFTVHVSTTIPSLDVFVLFSQRGPCNCNNRFTLRKVKQIHLKTPSPEGQKKTQKNLDEEYVYLALIMNPPATAQSSLSCIISCIV